MYKRGDGTVQDDVKAKLYKAKTQDMLGQYNEQVSMEREGTR